MEGSGLCWASSLVAQQRLAVSPPRRCVGRRAGTPVRGSKKPPKRGFSGPLREPAVRLILLFLCYNLPTGKNLLGAS